MAERDGRVDVTVALRWRRLGLVRLDLNGSLAFPSANEVPGLYRLRLLGTAPEQQYIGQTDKLRRRFGQFRAPGPTQVTNRRINRLLVEHLEAGGSASADVAADGMAVSKDGAEIRVDLADKWTRRLLESAGVFTSVAEGHEVLNR